ncbi:MAG: hypothetical protein ACREQI_04200 [Candidatus Binataceae bacterium]
MKSRICLAAGAALALIGMLALSGCYQENYGPSGYGYGSPGYAYAPSGYGDYDAHHQWHDRDWWVEHDRGWVETHHRDWIASGNHPDNRRERAPDRGSRPEQSSPQKRYAQPHPSSPPQHSQAKRSHDTGQHHDDAGGHDQNNR